MAKAKADANKAFQFADLPEGDLSIDSILKHMKTRNAKMIAHETAKKWRKIKVNHKGPFGLLFFGDPHLDDNYCNLDLLQQHIEIAKHPAIYGVNIGDTTNNWAGKLERLYAEQESSKSTAYKLIEWFMFGSGVKWFLWVQGNHDAWGEGAARMKAMGANMIQMEDWRAQLALDLPNGKEVLLDIAHDHKGHSMYNDVHAQNRVAMMGRTPHIAVAGHRHHPGLQKKWLPEVNMVSWLARVGSYKWVDSYAKHNGFPNYQSGAAMIAIIDPNAKTPEEFIHMTDDLKTGVVILDAKRQSKRAPKLER